MMRVVLLLVSGCSFSHGTHAGDTPTGPIDAQAAIDAGPFANLTPLATLNTSGSEDDPTLTADLLEIYFERDGDIYYSVRTRLDEPWPAAQVVPNVNSTTIETTPEIRADGLELYFTSYRQSNYDIYVATRSDRQAPWSVATYLPVLSSASGDYTPTLVTDTVMYLSSERSGNGDLFRTTRASTLGPWSTPVVIPGLSSPTTETEPCIDAAETVVYYSGDGAGRDIFVAWRATASDPWSAPVPVAELNSSQADGDPWLTPDGHTMFLSSDRSGNFELYMATR